jgi:hypothetical protein
LAACKDLIAVAIEGRHEIVLLKFSADKEAVNMHKHCSIECGTITVPSRVNFAGPGVLWVVGTSSSSNGHVAVSKAVAEDKGVPRLYACMSV